MNGGQFKGTGTRDDSNQSERRYRRLLVCNTRSFQFIQSLWRILNFLWKLLNNSAYVNITIEVAALAELEAKVTAYHEFEPSTTEDQPCREALRVVQNSNVLPLLW
ncbi:hypothetical protein TNCV_890521 [Trichonephila clavipes]|nr:hypothetical protein TNCV_890521 [Trichonephila clavipes]